MSFKAIATAALFAVTGATAAHADLLDDIKARGELSCGTLNYLPGVGFLNDEGEWSGFDVDFCRAAAAAVLGDPNALKLVALTGPQKFPVLDSGEIDILSRSVTMTASRETSLGYDFIGPNLMSGQGFMVRKDSGVTSMDELDGATICVLAGTVTERYVADYFAYRKMTFTPVASEGSDQMYQMYFDGRCDAVTQEPPYMAIRRLRSGQADDHVILDQIVSKSFEAPLIREGSPKLREVLQWMHYGMVTAEELGITQANVEEMAATSDDPVVRSFLGAEGNIGEGMGVSNDWMVHVIKAVGNYGEFFDRNLGKNSPLGLERGMNALWRDGGAMTAPGWE